MRYCNAQGVNVPVLPQLPTAPSPAFVVERSLSRHHRGLLFVFRNQGDDIGPQSIRVLFAHGGTVRVQESPIRPIPRFVTIENRQSFRFTQKRIPEC